MKKIVTSLVLIAILVSCTGTKKVLPLEGIWLAELEVMDDAVLPFNFELMQSDAGKYAMKIFNADEVIQVDEIEITGDSIIIKPPVFEGYIAVKYTENSMEGKFIKESLARVVPFKATWGEENRFKTNAASTQNISGIWETIFSPDVDADTYMAKGVFRQQGDKVSGTFRTTTGDYRYLDGVMDGDSVKLSAFDGAHAFLFTAKVTDSTLNGTFYSGNHFKEPFKGHRNEVFELPDADSFTFLKEGYDKLAFSFPDANGNMISLKDDRYKNKVVLVQIMGSWCPNCLDETKFYVDYLKNNADPDLEIVGLAFEYAKTEEAAFNSISRLKERIGVEYPILLAQVGSSDKALAQEKLPMLNHVLSYPTSIFIDKKGAVRKIHTGFNGPATGAKFTAFQKEFDLFVKALLAE